MSAALVLLASGGTGGHMFPAEALASALLARGYRVGLVTDKRGRGFGEPLPGVEVHRISAGGLAGRGLVHRAQGVLSLSLGFLQARALLRRLAPRIAVGFGGYACVPTILAAQRAGIATMLHEQNAVLGRANRLLAARTRAVATSFLETRSLGRTLARFTGNPVRAEIAALGGRPYPVLGDRLHVLVLGGSQGAAIFARLIPAALELLATGLRARIALAQQCRPEDLEQVRARYTAQHLTVELAPFFEDMAERLARTHLVISRSGASTVAELTAAGRPAILLPYPYATDDHQTANAASFSAAGAGWLMPEATVTPQMIAERLNSLLIHPAGLSQRAAAARQVGRRDAADRLADLVAELAPANGIDPAKVAA